MGKHKNPEAVIENYLIAEAEKCGGLAVKLLPIRCAGIPDRLLILKNRLAFVELKAPGFKPRNIQRFRAAALKDLGYECFCVDTTDGVDALMEELRK